MGYYNNKYITELSNDIIRYPQQKAILSPIVKYADLADNDLDRYMEKVWNDITEEGLYYIGGDEGYIYTESDIEEGYNDDKADLDDYYEVDNFDDYLVEWLNDDEYNQYPKCRLPYNILDLGSIPTGEDGPWIYYSFFNELFNTLDLDDMVEELQNKYANLNNENKK